MSFVKKFAAERHIQDKRCESGDATEKDIGKLNFWFKIPPLDGNQNVWFFSPLVAPTTF